MRENSIYFRVWNPCDIRVEFADCRIAKPGKQVGNLIQNADSPPKGSVIKLRNNCVRSMLEQVCREICVYHPDRRQCRKPLCDLVGRKWLFEARR